MLSRAIMVALAAGTILSCGEDRLTQSPEQNTQPLGKLATQNDTERANLTAILTQNGIPVSWTDICIVPSISGRAYEYADYRSCGLTDEKGRARLGLSGTNITGYYWARAWDHEDYEHKSPIGSWSSIPVNAGQWISVELPIGEKASVTNIASLDNQTITFSELDWTSAKLQNRIAQYIIEKGYGYSTELIAGSSVPAFEQLRKGETDVYMEVWLPNLEEVWIESQIAGEVMNMGLSLGSDWQSAFVIPKYLQEQYPDLDSVEDLKEDRFKNLFGAVETGGSARLMSCVSTWGCAEINRAQIEAYGLTDHILIVTPDDVDILNDDLYRAYEKGEPWLGYQWGTNEPALLLDLVRLEEPEYTDECWAADKGCAYEDATIFIGVHHTLSHRAYDVFDFLGEWSFNIDSYKEVAIWQSENPNSGTNEAALWWLNTNPEQWGGWVTERAAEAIQVALDAKEIPDGWPGE